MSKEEDIGEMLSKMGIPLPKKEPLTPTQQAGKEALEAVRKAREAMAKIKPEK